MKSRAVILVAGLFAAALPVLAQTTAPAAPSSGAAPATTTQAATSDAPAAGSAAPELTKDGKPTMKSVRETCRSEVLSSGVKGDLRRQAMADCIIKQRPDMEPRIKCAMDPSIKDLTKDARRAAVKVCVQKAKS